MKNIKILTQIILVSIFVITSVVILKTYFNPSKIVLEETLVEEKKELIKLEKVEEEKITNFIEDIEYFSQDSSGNKYKITSKTGKIDLKNSEVIEMYDVFAILTLKNSEKVTIKSDRAKYNKENHETEFYENISMIYKLHKIYGEKLNLSFEEEKIRMSKKIVYINEDVKLEADKIEFDMITKNSRIFMNDNLKQVKISKGDQN